MKKWRLASLVLVLVLLATGSFITASADEPNTVNEPLALECLVSPNPNNVGLVTAFMAAASGGVPSYSWSWTVNGVQVAATHHTTFVFAAAGTYLVCVTVTDSLGNWKQCCKVAYIESHECVGELETIDVFEKIGHCSCPPVEFKGGLVDERGDRFQLFCASNNEFAFWYVPAVGSKRQVGRCPWAGGRNEAEITQIVDHQDADAKCFLLSKWRSREPGIWPFGFQGEPLVIDWKVYQFDVQTERLVLYHFTSVDGPGGHFADKLIKKAENIDPLDFNPDPIPSEAPMIFESHEPCDIDFDGDCDADDYEIVARTMGQCIDGDNYIEPADANLDGCVDETDQQNLFPVVLVRIDIKPGRGPNSIYPDSKGVIAVAILTTDVFDATTVDLLSVKFGPSGATVARGEGHFEDVDKDGDTDIVLHFKTQETGITCGDTSASVTGETSDGKPIEGSDFINTVGCK